MLVTGLSLTACKDNSVSSVAEEEEMKLASYEGDDIMSNMQVSSDIIIDDFNSGAGTFIGSGHNSKFEYHESSTILGGAREIYLRDAASGSLGGATYSTVDTDAGTLRLYKTGGAAAENAVMYGTGIGTVYRSFAPSPNIGAGSELNLELTLEDSILVEVAQTGNSGGVSIVLRSGNGGVYSGNLNVEVGSNLIALSEFPNMTETAAADIDGITFGGLNTFSVFAIKNATPEVKVYVSDSSVQTWDPIYPSTADPNWSSNVCYQSNDFGLTANWVNQHNAFEVTKDDGSPHDWDNSTFDAAWINSYNDMDSQGPGGHNWSKYETEVTGNGDFVVQLLADNCSWVYLADGNGNNPQLVGYQPAVSTPGEYSVTLDGTHKLTFVIFDGGGLAGGKFRLETTESFGGTPPPPIVTNTAPVADAGEYENVEATGTTNNLVTLDGSNSYDPDEGDELSYSWEVNGEIVNGVTTNVGLPIGEHTVTLTVTDQDGLSDTDTATIIIEDTTAPDLDVNQQVENLWPPNHKMVLVASISATDDVDENPTINVDVTSSESSNGRGDGNTDSDYDIVTNSDGSVDVYVRSERSGKAKGRTYSISVTASDTYNNTTDDPKVFEVQVAKSQGRAR
ncbi:MAG: hypothetical protein CL666_15760 [Balneola sp.]|nr:hypothetical protein [Balneola sp.]